MNDNILEDWSRKMKDFVWRNGLINVSPFSDIDKIKDNLTFFFGINKFEYDQNIPKTDQMYSLLVEPQKSSLYKLAEIANTISFYRDSTDFNILDLHGSKRRLSYGELQGRIFELFINKVFVYNGLQSTIHNSYQDTSSNNQPIDVTLKFQDNLYLIECYKAENQTKELLTKLIYQLKTFAAKFSNSISQGELFSGYILFKTEPLTPSIIHKTGIIFKDKMKEFIYGFRNVNNKVVQLSFPYENSDIEFRLISNLILKESNLDSVASLPFNSVIFKTVLHGEILGRITFDCTVNFFHRNYVTQIEEKIRRKIRQHKKSPIKKKIIAVEFENISDNKIYQGSMPVKEKDIDLLNFDKLVDSNTSILFWIKTINSEKYSTSIGFVDHPSFNKTLKSKFANLKINWY